VRGEVQGGISQGLPIRGRQSRSFMFAVCLEASRYTTFSNIYLRLNDGNANIGHEVNYRRRIVLCTDVTFYGVN